jgi:dTDP-4-amino-4,6-dideoxygalactose transaminase
MKIPFVDIKSQYTGIRKEMDDAIRNVINGAHFIQGPEVEAFESEFAKYLGTSYCVGVNSGTDALILGLRALGLPRGAEVIVPVNTFIATALAASDNGLTPVFVDIDPKDNGMDLKDLKKKINRKTKAVIIVHLYGQPEKIDEIQKIINDSGHPIYLIEDACQAHGATYKGKRVGTFGIFSAFSFYPGKNLGAYGDGGALVTNDSVIAEKFRMLREYGQKKKYHHESLGTNSRLDTIQAAVLLTKLKYLDCWNTKRQELADYYTKQIKKFLPDVTVPIVYPERRSIYHIYSIGISYRDELLQYLNKHGIQALIHYPIPLHLQKAYAPLGYKKGDFPKAEQMAEQILSLPIFPELKRKQIDYVIKTMSEFYAK